MAGCEAQEVHKTSGQRRRRIHGLGVLEAAAVTPSNPGTLQSIYSRARRICADKAQAHLRDFAANGEGSTENGLVEDPKEKTARSDVQEAA
jgi:hypothetical protein